MTALYYCSPTELEILKCCKDGENIDVVNGQCTNEHFPIDDFMKRVKPTVISEFPMNMRMDDYRLIIFRSF